MAVRRVFTRLHPPRLLGVVASPLLFPFVNRHSYLALMIVLAARWPRLALGVWLGFWLLAAGAFFLGRAG